MEIAWRSLAGQSVQQASGILSATDFPDGSKLKLEWIQGRAFLSYQQGGVSSAPWCRRLAIELGSTPQSGSVFGGVAFGSSSPIGATVSFAVAADQVHYLQKVEGACWMRVIEPYESLGENGTQGSRLSMQAYDFLSGSDYYSFNGMVKTQVLADESAGGDYWRVGLSGANSSASESFEFSNIKSRREDVVDVYMRLGEVGSQTALPSITMYRGDVSPVAGSLSPQVLGSGVWEFVGRLHPSATAPSIDSIALIFDWALAEGGKDRFAFDGLLLAGQTFHPDGNGDGLPDGFGGAYAHLIEAEGDFDGDGRSNYEEYLLGTDLMVGNGTSTLSITKFAPLDAPWYLARDHWSPLPAQVKVSYSGGQPVKGYPVRFLQPLSSTRIGFGTVGQSAPVMGSDFIALTNGQGVASAVVWLGSDSPLVVGTTSHHFGAKSHWSVLGAESCGFDVVPYDNVSPGPVDLIPKSQMLAKVASHNCPGGPSEPTLVVGEWMFAGQPLANSVGLVMLSKWDSVQQSWRQVGQLPLPPGLVGGANFGGQLTDDGDRVAIRGGGKLHVYDLSADRLQWQFAGSTPSLSGELKAMKGDWLAVASSNGRGSVSLYRKQANAWVFDVTLNPGAGTHSDNFGAAIAFSEDSKRLVVSADGNPHWYFDPANRPDQLAYVWREVEVEVPVYGVEIDEFGVEQWFVMYYMTELQGQWVWETVTPTAPTPGTVYIYDREPSGTWVVGGNFPAVATHVAILENRIWTAAAGMPTGTNYWLGYEVYMLPFEVTPIPTGEFIVVYQKNATTLQWQRWRDYGHQEVQVYKGMTSRGSRVVAWSEDFTDGSGVRHVGEVEVLKASPSGIQVEAELINSISAGGRAVVGLNENSLWVKCFDSYPRLEEYSWLASVPGDAPEETTVAGWVTSFDGNLSTGLPATESVLISLADVSSRWVLTAAAPGEILPSVGIGQTQPLSLRLKDNTGLAAMAPMVDWVGLHAVDKADDQYLEYHGVRIRGKVPSAPQISSFSPVGPDKVEIRWAEPLNKAEVIIVEASPAIYGPFFEVARVDAVTKSYIYHLTEGGLSVADHVQAFRLKAANSEGTSAVGNVVFVDLDVDDDGLPDWWEALYGNLVPTDDDDGDGFDNLAEYLTGSNPHSADTDGDGALDGSDEAPLVFNADNLDVLIHTVLK